MISALVAIITLILTITIYLERTRTRRKTEKQSRLSAYTQRENVELSQTKELPIIGILSSIFRAIVAIIAMGLIMPMTINAILLKIYGYPTNPVSSWVSIFLVIFGSIFGTVYLRKKSWRLVLCIIVIVTILMFITTSVFPIPPE